MRLLYPKHEPRSVRQNQSEGGRTDSVEFRAHRASTALTFSTILPASQGARNWPFLIFKRRPYFRAASDAATIMSVWRHKKAGTCKKSTTSATGSACSGV